MSKRDTFLLRVDPKVLAALRKWSDDELRSVNSQNEYILSKSPREAGRVTKDPEEKKLATA